MLFGTVIHASWLLHIFPCVTNEEGTMRWILWVENIPSIVRYDVSVPCRGPRRVVSWAAAAPRTAHTTSVPCILLYIKGTGRAEGGEKIPGGGHACSAPAFQSKTQDGPEDGHCGHLGLIWGGDTATKDGPGGTVSQSPFLLSVREGDHRAATPGLGTTPWSHCSTAVGVPHLHPYPKSITELTGCCCLKM